MSRVPPLVRELGLRSSARKVLRSISRVGLRATIHRVRAKLDAKWPELPGVYQRHYDRQEAYVRQYAASPDKGRMHRLLELLASETGHRGVVLYPAAYRLELKQRPEHLLRALADEGWLCLMLTVGGAAPSVQRLGPRLYATSLFEDALTHFRHEPVALYLTFPAHAHVARFLERAFVVYDVLDRLQIFAGYGKAMERDHQELLGRADLALSSSPALYEANAPRAHRCILVPNGVYPEHFASAGAAPEPPPTVLGYYGAISELLDFDLFDALTELSDVRLALAGPIAHFRARSEAELRARTEALFARPNVAYEGTLAYEELPRFLGRVHAALVPFRVDTDTDAVSPLKLFEYLAAKRPVLATPTRGAREHADAVFVGDRAAIVERVRDGSFRNFDAARAAALVARHAWPVLAKPVVEALGAFQRSESERPRVPAAARAHSRRVDVVNASFFDPHGEILFKGGAERYVLDLAALCRARGLEVRILQNAEREFRRSVHGFEVLGLPLSRDVDSQELSKGFARATEGAELVIASPLELACRFPAERALVGINHGIHWDARDNAIGTFSIRRVELLRDAIQRCDACVCVDTNFVNWVRTFEWRLARHLHYVPNYVDTERFRPVPKDFDAPRLVALYPRRLYDARGLNETLEAFDYLLDGSDALELHLCGQATGADAERTRRFVEKHRGLVQWYELEMDEMHRAYERSHVALVPTVHSEGTSLSCIEAMATNNAVIATNVGGLPNLVLDGFNGLLIRPDAWDLVAAVRKLLDDRRLAETLARRALEVAQTLAKPRWEARWLEILGSVIELPAS